MSRPPNTWEVQQLRFGFRWRVGSDKRYGRWHYTWSHLRAVKATHRICKPFG